MEQAHKSGKPNTSSCIVIGAGLSGLLAARTIQQQGIDVVVLDKGRGVGGRMATRRVQAGVFDYGAQFFTVRDQRFLGLVERLREKGIALEWARGFPSGGSKSRVDGHIRYRGNTGMTAIPKHLAQPLEIELETRVIAVRKDGNTWTIVTDQGKMFVGQGLILTPPVPQSLAVLDAGAVNLPATVRTELGKLVYDPCIALLALLDQPSQVPAPGGIQLGPEPIAWIADNRQKGISPGADAITIHAGPEFSQEYWEKEDKEVAEKLITTVKHLLGSKVLTYQIHRWRYSKPVRTYHEPCLYVPGTAPLIFAGDAFARPRVEGAALSGLAAAEHIILGR